MRHVEYESYGVNFAQIYDRMVPPLANPSWVENSVISLLRDVLDGRIIEFGVGTGRVAIPLAAALRKRLGESIQYVGIDGSPEMLKVLREKDLDHHVSTAIADLTSWEALQVASVQAADVILCVGGTFPQIQSTSAQLAVFSNAARLLRPGGTLVVECHNPPAVKHLVKTTGGTLTLRYPSDQTALIWFTSVEDETGIWEIEEVWIEGGSSKWLRETTLLTSVEQLDEYASRCGMQRMNLAGPFGTDSPYSRESMMYTTTFEKREDSNIFNT